MLTGCREFNHHFDETCQGNNLHFIQLGGLELLQHKTRRTSKHLILHMGRLVLLRLHYKTSPSNNFLRVLRHTLRHSNLLHRVGR
jgi:hypothetical protein